MKKLIKIFVFLFLSITCMAQTFNATEYFSSCSDNWSIKERNEDLVFFEPEQNKEWAYFKDDWGLKLTGAPNIDIKGQMYLRGKGYISADSRLYFGRQDENSGWLSIHNDLSCYNNYFDFSGSIFFRAHTVSNTNEGATLGIQNNGTVTIGIWEKYNDTYIDTEGHKLSVNGGILCKYITVKTDVPTSDYVFENNYDLMPLNEVETFVKEHKHLPEVPSAREFKENGYKVGEMDDLLLRKVEELTLYIIDLEKKNQKLSEKVESMVKSLKVN